MSKIPVSIQLYDTDITDLLNGWGADIALPRSTPDHLGVFENLQEQELIYAISRFNYSKAYSLLRRLDHVLSPADAMAACLCALSATPKLMNTLLDHCPPIPEFQFQGVGEVSSLLNVTVRHDKYKMLDILLKRGADPNGGPTPLTEKSPVEEALCGTAYSCVKRLMEIPDLQITLTEEMLEAWGALTTDTPSPFIHNPCGLWCCQLLLEKLTGEPTSLVDPLPIPPQLRLGHALHHANFELAAHICNTRPLTDADAADVLEHYAIDRLDCSLLHGKEFDAAAQLVQREQEIRFLCQLLRCRPELLHTPQLRSAVALAALALPEEDPFLAYWVHQMEDGPVLLPHLPFPGDFYLTARFITGYNPYVALTFFPRWEQRLGPRLIPTLDINAPFFDGFNPKGYPDPDMGPDMVRLILERVRFVGTPPADALSPMATEALQHAPEDLLPQLLQPGEFLARENPVCLLDACHALPAQRRNLILLHISKTTSYAL